MITRIVGGHNCLPLPQEAELYELTEDELEEKIRSLFSVLGELKLVQVSLYAKDIKILNSLLWIYAQRPGVVKRFELNLRILWTVNGLNTINEFSNHIGMNASFMGKIMIGHPVGGLGGWNFATLSRVASGLGVRLEVLLLFDLSSFVREATGMTAVKTGG